MNTNVQVEMSSLRDFAQEARTNGIKNKSAFVKWFRNVKGGSAAQSRLHDAWRTSNSEDDILSPVTVSLKKEVKEKILNDNIQLAYGKILNFIKIHDLIETYQHAFESGSFYLNRNESINKILTANNVPSEYGIYIIYSSIEKQEEIIYIGKAGTIGNNGQFKRQGLKERLSAVRDNNISGRKYFQQVIQDYEFDKLRFIWIVTFGESRRELPAYSEAKFIQSYFDEHDKLPLLNKSI